MDDGTDREVSAELEELTRQVADLSGQMADTRKQLIKTSNILGNLQAEVKAVGRQRQLDRRGLSLNSAAAYVLFVGLTAAGFYFLYRSQVERLDSEKNALVRARGAALTELSELRKAAERRAEAEGRAAAFYRMTRVGRVHKALGEYPEVAQLPLSKVEAALFRDWADRTKSRIAYTAYSAGMKAVGEKQWKRAVTELKAALTYTPHPPHEAPLRYYYGFALMKVGSYKEAVEELERALAAGAEKTVSREVRFHIATIYEQTARREQAIRAYRGYIKRHPGTSFARAAQRRVKALE
jgi:tetratricopeptide (TPR) repeat protein